MEQYEETLSGFRSYLEEQEKSEHTVMKYIHDVTALFKWMEEKEPLSRKILNKQTIHNYKEWLINNGYRPVTANCMMASISVYLNYIGHPEYKVRRFRIQRVVFCPEEKFLRYSEYKRLVDAAEKQKKERLSLLLQTICATGIRVSELRFITTEALEEGSAVVSLKGKTRMVILPKKLRLKLKKYCKKQGTKKGPIFLTRTGKILDRTMIWKEMKGLCKEANVSESKVYPHNLRHLFARAYYEKYKDIVKLADILGHSSINTTWLYVLSTGEECRNSIKKLGLVA